MTQEEFIAAVVAEPTFLKWATVPEQAEETGEVQKWKGVAYVTTPDGTNLVNVWYIVDTKTGNTTWQNGNTLSPVKNSTDARLDKLAKYLKATFFAYTVLNADLENYWAVATVYTASGNDLTKSTVLIYKIGASAVTHKTIL